MGTWTNSDGLYIKYGATEVTATAAGEYDYDSKHCIEVEIPLTSLSTSANYYASDTVTIPNGARIEEIEVIAETAATSGGSATLDIGLIDQDRSTAFDDDGLVAALALTSIDADGEKTVIRPGSTSVGALVGTTLSNTGLIVASANVAVFTAGRVIVRIFWYKP
jgi:hypothetical protein